MKVVLLLVLLLPYSYANSKIHVTGQIDGDSVNLGIESPVYGDIIGLLSTCSRYGKLIVDPSDLEASYKKYDFEASRIELTKVKQKDHIKVSYSDHAVNFPVLDGNVLIEEIYVGFSKLGYPKIYTHGGGLIYSYSKCSGYLLVEHFQCNTDLRKYFKIEPQRSSCKNH